MSVTRQKMSVTYSSGLLWQEAERDMLSTLSVFYDEIWLPYPYGLHPPGIALGTTVARDSLFYQVQELYAEWRERWGPLFNQGILRTLDPPIEDFGQLPPSFREQVRKKMDEIAGGYGFNVTWLPDDAIASTVEVVESTLALAIHALYGKKPAPELFISDPLDTSTSRLAGVLVHSLFQYQIPRLQRLEPEQVLEVREHVDDVKQGFIDFIFEMVDDVESRLRSGDRNETEAARKTIERKILPQYNEMRRKIDAKKVGFWSNVLAAGSKILQIDAAPWTPKFYGGIFEAFFGSAEEVAKAEEESCSNKNQSLQYLARLRSATEAVQATH